MKKPVKLKTKNWNNPKGVPFSEIDDMLGALFKGPHVQLGEYAIVHPKYKKMILRLMKGKPIKRMKP